jgi:hypothetical protein
MFRPNLVGQYRATTGRDVHGRSDWGPWRVCPFAIVNFDIGTIKTSVRADSSASRGTADVTATQRAAILVPAVLAIKMGDQFRFDGDSFQVTTMHARRSVLGKVDHIQVGLELVP